MSDNPREAAPRTRWERFGRPATTGLFALFILYNILTWYDESARSKPALEVGSAAPTLDISLLDGSSYALGAANGRVTLVDFWATWCAPCVKEMPEFATVARRFEGRPLEIVLVNQRETPNEIRSFMEGRGIDDLTVALDNGHAGAAYRVERLPYLVLLDHEGKIRFQRTGFNRAQDLERLVENLVKQAEEAGS